MNYFRVFACQLLGVIYNCIDMETSKSLLNKSLTVTAPLGIDDSVRKSNVNVNQCKLFQNIWASVCEQLALTSTVFFHISSSKW